MRRARISTLALAAPLFVCAALLGMASCKRDAAEGAAPKGAASGGAGGGGKGGKGGGNAVFAVDTLRVENKKVDYVVTAPGTIDAFERVQVTARVAGPVDRVSFTEGQQVAAGAALVTIDSERYLRAVNGARAAVEKAQAAQKDTESMVTRREGASDQHPGLIPGEELATYKTKALTAKADTQVAVEALKLAELNLRDSSVRAPISGVIQTRTVETGQYVQAGYVMATLLRNDPMLLRFEVEPQEAPRLKPGMMAAFTLRETQRTFNAKITLVSGAADVTTHMVGVTAEVADDGHKYWLRPGSFCDVSIDIGAPRDAIMIPRIATRGTDKGNVVYVIENDVAATHVVTLGMNTRDGWVEVRTGLKPGDAVVIHGGEALSDGAKVRNTVLASFDAGVPLEPDAGPIGDDPVVGGGSAGGTGTGAGAADGGHHRRAPAAAASEASAGSPP